MDTIIEADNLEALKLLQDGFKNKIRFIYIDPPYNTGKQFTYKDHFRGESKNNLHGNNLKSNLASHLHSPWLSMMYPRIMLARELLKEDGVIYVSIDDSEVHNLILIMDEIFGENNRAGIITWVKKKKGSHLSKTLRCMTEYILVYGKNINRLDLWGEDAYTVKWQPLIKRINKEKILSFRGGTVESTLKKNFYPSGIYGTGGTAVELLNDINIKEGIIVNDFSLRARTVWTQEYLEKELELGTRVSIRSEGMGPNVFRHDQASKKKRPPTILDEKIEIGTNEDAWNELRDIFGVENAYSYPKPVSLIKYLIKTISKDDPTGIYLDFFAGSGTTG
jgi:adenine-specific DNA-methyltransferase